MLFFICLQDISCWILETHQDYHLNYYPLFLNLKLGTSHPPRPTVTEKPSPKLEHDKRKPALPLPTGA